MAKRVVVAAIGCSVAAIALLSGLISIDFADKSDNLKSGSLCEYVHTHIGDDYSHASPSKIIVDPGLGEGTEDEFTTAELFAYAYTLASDQIVPDDLSSDWALFVSELRRLIDNPQLIPSDEAQAAAAHIEAYLDDCES